MNMRNAYFHKIISFAICIFLCLLIIKCDKQIDFSIPKSNPQIVIQGENKQGSFIRAFICYTRGVTDTLTLTNKAASYTIKNASALLYDNNILIDTLRYDTATYYYTSKKTRVVAGKTYKLTVSAPGYTSALVTSYTPYIVPIQAVTVNSKVKTDRNGQYLDEVLITFKDTAIKNYYRLRLYSNAGTSLSCVSTYDVDIEKLVNEPFSLDDCINSSKLLLSDNNFQGLLKTIVLYVPTGALSPSGTKKATIELQNITQEYYTYLKSLNQHNGIEDNPFAELFNLFSNVDGGYGFFTTFSFSSKQVN